MAEIYFNSRLIERLNKKKDLIPILKEYNSEEIITTDIKII